MGNLAFTIIAKTFVFANTWDVFNKHSFKPTFKCTIIIIERTLPAFPVSQTCREGLYSWWSLLTSSASPEWTMCASEGLQSRPLRFRYKIQKALSFIWFWNTGIWNPLTLDTFALKLLISFWEWAVMLRLSSTWGSLDEVLLPQLGTEAWSWRVSCMKPKL